MMNQSLFSSNSPEWETPPALFSIFDDQYHFTLDVCATKANAKCKRFFSPEDDGLAQDWSGERCWMNPPYGREIINWVEKAWMETEALVVALLPARTDTKWFHEYVYGQSEIIFWRGRLRFVGAASSAPFPSMICVYHA